MNELLKALGLMFAIDECNIKCQEEQFVLRDMSNNIGNIIPYNSPFVHWHYVTEFGQQLIKYQYAQSQQQQDLMASGLVTKEQARQLVGLPTIE